MIRYNLTSAFFFQAEDGIRDLYVTGVQTCALPIFVFREQPAQALDVARRFRCVRLGLAETGLRGDEARARRFDFLFRGGDAALRVREAAARGRLVAGRRGGRDRHVAPGGDGACFGVGELGARLLDRYLVIARVELDENRARLDGLIVLDRDLRHRAADARRYL